MTMAAPPSKGRGRPRKNPPEAAAGHAQTHKNGVIVSEYEQSREERIKQNLEKMQKLGIFDLSLQLKSGSRTPKNSSSSPSSFPNTPKTPPSISSQQQSGPIRRSSRLKNVVPVSYSEVDLVKKDKELGDDEDVLPEVGSKLEVYTEKHEKLLGNTEKTWTLFVDGYGRDGKRIYDAVNGKTCHQCRQKTLGYRTHCSNCNMVQGQFCGDCLYMRYGEHVLEARENPKWVCPVCRGICNCSLCRQAKGWAPTGVLYKKVSGLGFKSVAHYLIQTHRLETKQGNSRDTPNEVSVKRSLPFSDLIVLSEDSLKVTNGQPGSPIPVKDKTDDESKTNNGNQNSAKRLLPSMNTRGDSENIESLEVDHKVDDLVGSPKHQHQNEKEDGCQIGKYKESLQLKSESRKEGIADDDFLEVDKKALDANPAVNEIALEKERGEDNDTLKVKRTSTGITGTNHDDKLPGADEKISDVKQIVEREEEKEELSSDVQHHGNVNISLQQSPKLKRKCVHLSLDSIGGRVRTRHKMGHSHNYEGPSEKENLNLKQATKDLSKSTSCRPSSESIAGRLRSRRKFT